MLAAIKYNLAHLTDFNGRDARQTFWFYVLFLVLVQMAISFAISLAMGGSMVGGAINAARDGVAQAEMQQRMMVQVGSMMRATMWVSIVLSLAMIAFLLAAFVRRLHDSGRPAWIAFVAAGINVVALVLMVAGMNDMLEAMEQAQAGRTEAMAALSGNLALRSLLGWVPTIVLIVFGVWPSTPGDNRYGPQPHSL